MMTRPTLLQQIVAMLVAVVVLFVAAGLLGSRPARAQDLTWLHLGQTKHHTYEGRSGSFRLVIIDGEEMVTATIRTITRTGSRREVTFERYYVSMADCEAGEGKLIATQLDGTRKYRSDFMFNGGNAASLIAHMICIIAPPDQPQPQPSGRF